MDIRDPKSIRNFMANGLCRVGEITGIERLTYNPFLYSMFDDMALKQAPPLADAILARYPDLRSVVDVGCGTGVLAREMQRRGKIVFGYEYSARARRYAARKGVTVYPFEIQAHVTQRPLQAPFDLAVSTEVAEHLPKNLAGPFVDFMIGSSPLVIFTAAHPGQGGHGHINEQPQSYWIEKFAERGRPHDAEASVTIAEKACANGCDPWLYENLMVFPSAP